jgi:hypothetical protein
MVWEELVPLGCEYFLEGLGPWNGFIHCFSYEIFLFRLVERE